jgi:hypothetical protein
MAAGCMTQQQERWSVLAARYGAQVGFCSCEERDGECSHKGVERIAATYATLVKAAPLRATDSTYVTQRLRGSSTLGVRTGTGCQGRPCAWHPSCNHLQPLSQTTLQQHCHA